MSIIATMLSALGGSSAAGAVGSAAGSAATATAGSSFLGGLMDKGASALSTIGEYAGAATDAIGATDFAGDEMLTQLNNELTTLKEEAEFIKGGVGVGGNGGYDSEEAQQADLAENAARTQEVLTQIDKIKSEKESKSSGLQGTLKANAGSTPAATIQSAPGVSTGQVDQNALVGAAMSGLSGTLGGAPKTTQQQLIQAQNQAFGGFRV